MPARVTPFALGVCVINKLRVIVAVWVLLALGVMSGPALALGLGQIQVRSQAGQPLLAEIPIISSDPSELDSVKVQLASPDTFTRIGLEPPQGIVSDLQFTVALDAGGNPVIRVTSQAPVQQALLTFLVQIDWDRGRLVREYSALLDTPRTVAAPAQPPIQAPAAAPSNTIVREPTPASEGSAAPVAEAPAAPPAAPPSEPAPPPAPVAAAVPEPEPTPPSNAIPMPPPAPPVAAQPAPAPVPAAPASSPAGDYQVQAGDTLGKIAGDMPIEGYSLDQTMLALLRANPDAFIDGNINLVKRGAVLRTPQSAELTQYSAAQARAVVHEQVGQWRQMHQPAPQPAAVAGEAANTSTTPKAQARVADARLEITPPAASDGRQAGTTSGIDAGGEGDMLRQELQTTKETLAARDAEVQELKGRVADLEKLQSEQQQLIALKDSKLAQAQQTLTATNQATAARDVATPAAPQSQGWGLWPWSIVAIVVALLLAWLWRRGRKPAATRPLFDGAALASGMEAKVATSIRATAAPESPVEVIEPVRDQPAPAEAAVTSFDADDTNFAGVERVLGAVVPDEPVESVEPVEPVHATPAQAEPTRVESPPAARPRAKPEPTAPEPAAPTWHGGGKPPAADSIAPLNAAPAGHERLELARAYMDLGDTDTARSLLQEVAEGGDATARGEAVRLLRELV